MLRVKDEGPSLARVGDVVGSAENRVAINTIINISIIIMITNISISMITIISSIIISITDVFVVCYMLLMCWLGVVCYCVVYCTLRVCLLVMCHLLCLPMYIWFMYCLCVVCVDCIHCICCKGQRRRGRVNVCLLFPSESTRL